MTIPEIITEIAADVDGKVRQEYSGRAMFDRTCMGIVTDSPERVIELAKQHQLGGHRMDNMGLKYIVYWPRPYIKKENEEQDEEEDLGLTLNHFRFAGLNH